MKFIPELHSQFCRVIEYAELKGTHNDHGVQFLSLHRTPQKSHQVPKSIVHTLIELRQAVTTSMGSLSFPQFRACKCQHEDMTGEW